MTRCTLVGYPASLSFDGTSDASLRTMLASARILVADDDPELLRAVSEALEASGATVVRAESGAELIELMADEGPFALVVTDISMPWMDGLQAMHSARHAGLGTPIVVMTALDDEHLSERIRALGRNTVLLRKPFHVAELNEVAERLLSSSAIPDTARGAPPPSSGALAGTESHALAAVFDMMEEAVVVTDADGRVLVANRAARESFPSELNSPIDGKSAPLIELRRPSGEPVLPRDLTRADAHTDASRAGGENLWICGSDGALVPIVVTATAIGIDAGEPGTVMVLRKAVHSDREVALREEWAAVVAHDLRQPLNTIVLTSDLLLQSATAEDQRAQLMRLQASAKRLSRMVGDMARVVGQIAPRAH